LFAKLFRPVKNYTVNRKNTKMFLTDSLQNQIDYDKIVYVLS